MDTKEKHFRVVNDPKHVCSLPEPEDYPSGTEIVCYGPRLGGPQDKCFKRYTRSRTFWKRIPYWADYDYGW